MDDLLGRAYERRERLRAELRAIETFIAQYEQLRAPSHSAAAELPLAPPESPSMRQREKTDLNAVLDAAERAILAEGRPLSRGTLLRMLEDKGYKFAGGDKVKVFGTNLWRSGRFKSLKGLGYWPEAHPLPAAFADADERSSQIKDHE